METGGDLLLQRRVRQQITRELPDGELVERQVAVERVNDPVAVFPNLPRRVYAVAVRVGVTGGVEPPAAPTLAVMRLRQQSVHHPLVSVGARVAQKLFHFLRRRRQPAQVQAQPANQGGAAGLRRRRDAFLLQPGKNKPVDGIPRPCRTFDQGRRGTLRGDEGPMFRFFRPFIRGGRGSLIAPRERENKDECIGSDHAGISSQIPRKW